METSNQAVDTAVIPSVHFGYPVGFRIDSRLFYKNSCAKKKNIEGANTG
jgi:hypothetical protein